MASEVFNREEVTLQDGVTVELRPLVIFKLRKFMKIWNGHINQASVIMTENQESENPQDVEDKLSDMLYDTFVKLCAFGLEDEIKGDKTEKQFKEYLESTLDEPTIYKILDVTGGLKLGPDQNLTQPGTAMAPDGMN